MVPRFGFADPDDYYSRASAAEVLDRLRVPCLLVASEIDPVITRRAIAPYLPAHAASGAWRGDELPPVSRDRGTREDRPAAFTVLWHPSAGHVAFPGGCDLESRILGWLAAGR